MQPTPLDRYAPVLAQLFPKASTDQSDLAQLAREILYNPDENLAIDLLVRIPPVQLNTPLSERRITCLQLCAMTNRCDLAQRLLASGATFSQDSLGWTALHHACLLDDPNPLCDLLKAGCSGIENARTSTQLTHKLMLERMEYVPPPSDLRIYYRDRQGTRSLITAEQFRDTLGIERLACRSRQTAQKILDSWLYPEAIYFDTMEQSALELTNWQSWQKISHKLVLAATPEIDGCHGIQAVFGFQAEETVCLYEGVQQEPEPGSGYVLGNTDAVRERGWGAMLNHGFPNCAFLYHARNGFTTPFVRTVCSIGPNERLLVDYGGQYRSLWDFPLVELNKEGMLEFFRQNHLKDLILGIEGHEPNLFTSRIGYLSCTPTASMHLLFEEAWTIEELRAFFAHSTIREIALFDGPCQSLELQHRQWIDTLAKFCKSHSHLKQEVIFKVQSESAEKALQYCLDLVEC